MRIGARATYFTGMLTFCGLKEDKPTNRVERRCKEIGGKHRILLKPGKGKVTISIETSKCRCWLQLELEESGKWSYESTWNCLWKTYEQTEKGLASNIERLAFKFTCRYNNQ